MPRKRNWKKGAKVDCKEAVDGKAIVTGERCWQCRCKSVANYTSKYGNENETCLNGCGPRSLCNLLRF